MIFNLNHYSNLFDLNNYSSKYIKSKTLIKNQLELKIFSSILPTKHIYQTNLFTDKIGTPVRIISTFLNKVFMYNIKKYENINC